MDPSVSGIAGEAWQSVILTVPEYPDQCFWMLRHGGHCSIPMSLRRNSKNIPVSLRRNSKNIAVSILNFCLFYFFFYSEESWKRVHGFVHTGIYSDTVLQTNIHGEVQVEE